MVNLAQVSDTARPDDPPAQLPAVINPMAMLASALERGADIEILTKLMDLSERWEKNQARKAFDNAMADAKAEMPVIFKNRKVDFTSAKGRTHYVYEDLAEVTRAVTPILAKHGLSHRFVTQSGPDGLTVTCKISHRDGHYETNTLTAGRDESGNKNSIQAVGSTSTYLQRMTLKAALGLAASDDDDGKAAGGSNASPILDAQVERLEKLIAEVGADRVKLCAYMKITDLQDMTQDEFDTAVRMLEAKRSRAS